MGLADYARPVLHRLVSPHHACHARACFFSCYLFPEQERHCGRRISPFPCSQHPSGDPRCRGLPLSPSSQHSSSSCSLCTWGIPSSFSCSPLFPPASQDIALSPRSPPSSPYHSRSASSAWTSHLALVLPSEVGAGLVLVAQMAPQHGQLLPYQTPLGGWVIRCSRPPRVAVGLSQHYPWERPCCPSCPRDIPRSGFVVPVVPAIFLGVSLLSHSENFQMRSLTHDHHCSNRLLYHPRH
jgi:hypothetical protein